MSYRSEATLSESVGRLLPVMCPLLVFTVDTTHAAALAVATFVVVVASNLAISMLHAFVPAHIRLPAFALVIGLFVTTVVLAMQALVFDLTERIALFASVLAAICISLAHTALNPPREIVRVFVDSVAFGLTLGAALIVLGAAREMADGTLPPTAAAPAAFLVVGLAMAAKNALAEKA